MPYQFENESVEIPEDLRNLKRIIENYLGYKVKNTAIDVDRKSLFYFCYDSFELKFSLGERYGEFGASMAMGNGYVGLASILGKRLSLNSDEKSVIENLRIIDEYCRLRLPDKYLEEFDTRIY